MKSPHQQGHTFMYLFILFLIAACPALFIPTLLTIAFLFIYT